LTKNIKSVLWGIAVRLFYIQDAWCLKVKIVMKYLKMLPTCFGSQGIHHQGALYSAWPKLQ